MNRGARYGRRSLSAVAASAALLLAGCTPLTLSGGGAGGGQPSAMVTLQRAMNNLVAAPAGPPGIVITIGRGSQVTLKSAGVSNIVTKAKPALTNYMRMASVSKAFSGAAALSLVTYGRLKLSDTVGKWLPGLPKAWRNVTLTELLSHTSGVPDFTSEPRFIKALLASLQTPPSPRKLLSFITDPTLRFTPGTEYKYSNSDNIVIGLMIAAAAHRSYESVLATNVFAPLGLTRTSLPRGSAIPTPTLRGYDALATPLEDVTNLLAAGWTWASGGVLSTPADALRFVRGYVSGALVNNATHAAQFTFRPGSSEPPGPGTNFAGLGIFKYVTSCGTVYGHTGNIAGYTQFVAATADGRHAVTVSINTQTNTTMNAASFAKLRQIYTLAVCAAR